MTKGMKVMSLILLGSLAMILSVNAAPKLPKLSSLVKPALYPLLRKMAKDTDSKIACVESHKEKLGLSDEKIAEIKEFALKLIKEIPPTDPELTVFIKSLDNDPRVAEILPTFLKNALPIMACAKDRR